MMLLLKFTADVKVKNSTGNLRTAFAQSCEQNKKEN